MPAICLSACGKVLKIGAKVVAHRRYLVFRMVEIAVLRELFLRGRRPPRGGVPPVERLGRGAGVAVRRARMIRYSHAPDRICS